MSAFRQALRALWRSPAYTLGATGVLAFAIGLNATTFSIVDAILLKPLPYRQPSELFGVQDIRAAASNEFLSPAEARALKDEVRSFRELAFYRGGTAGRAAVHPDGDDAVSGYAVSPNLLRVLGVQPALGGGLPGEDRAAGSGTVLISDQVWRRRFGGAPDVLGKTLRIGGRAYVVVGVMPKGFWYPVEDGSFWIGLGDEPASVSADERTLSAVGRLRAGVAPQQAAAEVEALIRRLDTDEKPGSLPRRGHVDPLAQVGVPGDAGFLYLMQGIVWCVVLVTCANVSNLVLVRTLARRRETAVQVALGASRGALARPLLAEAVLTVGAASVVGVGASLLALRQVVGAVPAGGLANLGVGSVSVRNVVAAVATAAAIVALCNAAPVLELFRTDVNEVLKGGGPSAAGRPRSGRLRGVLLASQVAVSLVLLTSAAALVRSVADVLLWRPTTGVRTLFAIDLGAAPAGRGESAVHAGAVAARLRQVAGVGSVAASAGMGGATVATETSGGVACECRQVTHEMLGTAGIPLRRGRDLTEVDEVEGAAVVDEQLARTLWGAGDPIGRYLTVAAGAGRRRVRVVGVAAHVELAPPSVREPQPPPVYLARRLDDAGSATLLVRARGGAALTGALRGALAEVAPGYPAHRLRTMGETVDAYVAPMRWYVAVLGGLTAFALCLAAIGLYAAVAFTVRERRAEIAIRTALGAPRVAILRLVGGGAARVTLAGGAVGMLGGVAASTVMVSQVAGAGALSPGVFAAVAAVFAATVAAAAVVPAWRAGGVDAAGAMKGG
jgi:putative ABC transport system permease protein